MSKNKAIYVIAAYDSQLTRFIDYFENLDYTLQARINIHKKMYTLV